jgi:hypothetical protein
LTETWQRIPGHFTAVVRPMNPKRYVYYGTNSLQAMVEEGGVLQITGNYLDIIYLPTLQIQSLHKRQPNSE